MIYAKQHQNMKVNRDFIDSIQGALFFGVPSEGMDIRSLRPMVKGQPNEHLLNLLTKGSRTLKTQSQTFSRLFQNYLRPPVAFFYENRPSKTARQVGPMTPILCEVYFS
jgi:hypothetical protein